VIFLRILIAARKQIQKQYLASETRARAVILTSAQKLK